MGNLLANSRLLLSFLSLIFDESKDMNEYIIYLLFMCLYQGVTCPNSYWSKKVLLKWAFYLYEHVLFYYFKNFFNIELQNSFLWQDAPWNTKCNWANSRKKKRNISTAAHELIISRLIFSHRFNNWIFIIIRVVINRILIKTKKQNIVNYYIRLNKIFLY